MRKLLIYLEGYTKETVLAPLFKLLEASFELFVPLVMAAVIDVGIGNGDKPYIVKMCLVLVMLGVVGLACSITAQYYAAKSATGFAGALRHNLFKHIQSLSFSEMDTIGTSTLITRMTSDVNQAQSAVNLVLRLFMRSPFIVVGAMIMAFTVDEKAALIFAVTIPLLSIVVFGVMALTMPLYKKVQSNLDRVLLMTRENLTGARVIRAFNKEEGEVAQFEKDNQALTDTQKFVGGISGLMNPITYIVVNGAVIVLIYTGAIRVNSGALTQGEVVALLNYMAQILVELVKFANLIITVTKGVACGNRIQSVFEMHSEMTEGTVEATDEEVADREAADKAVVFENVSLRYRDAGADSLSGISFCVKKGETIGIIGGTGSGKSSLVNLIPRFYDVAKGRVLVDGVDVKDYKTEALRDKIGVVMQKAVLFAGTIADNLRWGNENASVEEMEEALAISQAKEFVDTKEGGLAFVIEQNGRNLSGGQKQRMTIARALVKKPEILILDDSASALDYATDAKLRGAIKGMKNSPTVFIVSQRAASIQYADQIIVLDDGEMVGLGRHEELIASCPEYQEIYYSQFPKEAANGK